MVEVGSASGGDDTGSVRLEGELVSFDGNGDWSLGDGGLKLGWASLGNIVVVGNLSGSSLGGLAGSISGGVWVGRLGVEWGLLNVLEGVVHESSIASVVSE